MGQTEVKNIGGYKHFSKEHHRFLRPFGIKFAQVLYRNSVVERQQFFQVLVYRFRFRFPEYYVWEEGDLDEDDEFLLMIL